MSRRQFPELITDLFEKRSFWLLITIVCFVGFVGGGILYFRERSEDKDEGRQQGIETITYCSAMRESLLYDFNLPSSTHLIMKSAGDVKGELWSISVNDLTPKPIPNLPQNEHFSIFWSISPNGQWILYFTGRIGGDESEALWMVSSIDGKQQWPVTQAKRNTQAFWVNDHQFIIQEVSSRDFGLTYGLELFDPFTLESEALPLPPNVRLLKAYLQRDEKTYAIYFENKQLHLFDYATQTSKPIFRWLETVPELYSYLLNLGLNTQFIVNQNENFNLVVRQPHGLDIALDIDWATMQNATNYVSVMHPILLFDEDSKIDLGGVIDANTLVFDLEGSTELTQDNVRWLYALDLQNEILHDYCLDRGLAHPPHASPNGQFLAWTVFEKDGVGNQHPMETIIMELSTGRIARVKDMELIGWGQTSQP